MRNGVAVARDNENSAYRKMFRFGAQIYFGISGYADNTGVAIEETSEENERCLLAYGAVLHSRRRLQAYSVKSACNALIENNKTSTMY